jgi:hypothetical protein
MYLLYSSSEKMPKSKLGENAAAFPEPEKLEFNVNPNIKNAIKVAEHSLDK